MTGKKFQPQPDQLLPKLALYSQSYQQEILLKRVTTLLERPIVSRQGLREALTNPISSARVFFGYYAFARAGGERAGYSEVCVRLLKGRQSYPDASSFLAAFKRDCKVRKIGANRKLTEGLVSQGYERLFVSSGALGWLSQLGLRIANAHEVWPIYLDLVSIPGVGPKIAAFLCRDLVWIFDCEKMLPNREQFLIQPIDTWIRQIAQLLWPELGKVEDSAELNILFAMRICWALEKVKVSGVEFNQGAWYFGSQIVKEGKNLIKKLESLQAPRSVG